ncbi:MAG: glucosylceramidase [Akkermansiaceae bacterium]|nr:glucosylceramidase [Akkermansiaceae bacterium]
MKKTAIHPRLDNSSCGASDTCSPTSIARRNFLKTTGLTAALLAAGRVPVMAGPFSPADFDKIIPADKKLSKDWIAGLYARGEALTATAPDLKYIGMPINGICTGQVYLGGDGQLWHWNLGGARDTKNNTPKGPRFVSPDVARCPMSQGFAIKAGGKEFSLDGKGFAKVEFTNQYPMATVDFADASCPVEVRLQAYTPFIPLNRDDSSYPVIVMRYTLKNTSPGDQKVAIAGWIENISNTKSGKRLCVYRELDSLSAVECSATMGKIKVGKNKAANALGMGSMALGLMGGGLPDIVDIARRQPGGAGVFVAKPDGLENGAVSELDFSERAFASLGKSVELKPGESQTISFALSWRFPITQYTKEFGRKTLKAPNHYATLWPTATGASAAVAQRENELYGTTRKWVDTWYDSTLPYWFLERTFVTVNCVQTQLGQRLGAHGKEPEYYNFDEGVKCCPGNCTHVWHYAQGLARVFPQIERECRDKVEFGLGFDPKSGVMRHRYGSGKFGDAIDGNCGTILRVLRESQMTTDYSFLKSIWSRVKVAMDHVIHKWDADEDGMLEGPQHNTLDEPWHGQVHWLINLYHAALKASAVMARQMDQPAVAQRYESIVAKGAPAMVDLLWNEKFGYFIHKPGESDHEKHGSTNGCHIDQVLGDSWLWNVGIDPILPKDKIRKSLEALWKYNFTPDVGAFRKVMTNGRWYATAGDAGLVMCTFPHGKIEPKSGKKSYAGYLNECMTGFEWQVAAHMIWEGMTEEGLAIGKAIYDRYQPKDRNPYNEIECSDHYSRAMASYGAYMAACGYQYDGPAGKLAFGPRLTPEDFRAGFTAAEGWGGFSQKVAGGQQTASLALHYGSLDLKEFAVDVVDGTQAKTALSTIDDKEIASDFKHENGRYVVRFPQGLGLRSGQTLRVKFVP